MPAHTSELATDARLKCVDKAHNLIDLWKAMEELKIEGLAKSIGVSNFLEHHMEEIASHWTGPPSVNQVSHQERPCSLANNVQD